LQIEQIALKVNISRRGDELIFIFFILKPKGKAGRNESIFKIRSEEFAASSSLLLAISEGKSKYKNTIVINIP
jgi:hypothetical protein